MMGDSRRKSCITEFESDLGKAAKSPFQVRSRLKSDLSNNCLPDFNLSIPPLFVMQELFAKFCSSSTIHGTYFWIASSSPLSRIGWGIIVIMGIISATWIINSKFPEIACN